MEQPTPAAAMSALLQSHRSIRRYDATHDVDPALLQQALVDAFAGSSSSGNLNMSSRLSRTDEDWCHLMELCRVLDTLIGDADNIYDLNRLDDQLLLGIKGTLSVMELGTLKLRMQQGREAKARRGEFGRALAPG